LANVLGRPFSKAMVIPIEMPLHEDSSAMPSFHLIIENSIPDSDISEVLDFCLERLEPLTTAIERIRVEQELIHFSYRWEKTFDGLKDPIAIIDRRDQVLRSNRKFATRGRKSECYEMFAGRTSRCEGCPVPQVLETGEVSKGEVRREGRVYEVYSYPIALVPGGRPTNVVNQYVDQTESRELYMRLLQSEKMGALGLLAGNIAHELNNPLTGIRSLAQVIKEGLDPRSQLAADLTEIEKAAERSQKIIRNLLEFVEQKDPVLSDVTVDDLIEKTLPFLKTAFRMLRVKKDLQTPNVIVRAEPQMLQQVFFNLIHNACQAMGKTGTLSLETEVNQDQLIFWVRDTGPGIAPEM
jgi:sensor histidine kinase regulating citrate/malate metabolism